MWRCTRELFTNTNERHKKLLLIHCIQEANLQRVQLEVKTGSDLDEVELRVVELLDQLIADCR